ncbi:MAG TPA: NAD(P)-dependent oxidoreductase [Gallionellaceae bacterium]
MATEVTADQNPRVALVTGATGFVGSHLVRRLVRDGWKVHIISRHGSTVPGYPEFHDITNHVHDGSTEGMVSCVAQTKPDVVFHLASMIQAQHEPKDIEPMLRGNVLFASQLIEGMRVNGVTKLVNTGTFWQHYNNEEYNPVCLYAATKQAFESILEYYVQACGFKVITLMLFDTYGVDDHRQKLFNILKRAATTGETLNMSPGEQLIAPVYVDDVTETFVLAADRLMKNVSLAHERYAVSPMHPIRLRDLVGLYLDISGRQVAINWGARPYRDREVMTPWNKGVWIATWCPKIELEEGLRRVISEI